MSCISVAIDVDDIIDDINSKDMIKALESRGYTIKNNKAAEEPFAVTGSVFNPDQLYRHLCDIVGCGYFEPKENLFRKLKELM